MKVEQCGLLVIGGGAAGFAAALEAATAGIDVTLLEKTADIGGSSAMSGGCLAFAGTDLQQAEGIEDSDDLLRRDLIEVGQNDADPALIDAYVSHQLDTYQWLRGLGLQFSPSLEASSGQSVPRVHTVDPADMVRLLAAKCRATGRVTVHMSTGAQRLVRESETAPVTGVIAEGPEGPCRFESARGVLLASGGFCRNAELVHRFAPQYAEAVFVGGEGNVGDGLRMAWKLGADMRDMAYIKGTFGKHPTDELNNHSCLAVYKGAIAVNQDGHRFVDESISYKLLGDAVMRQPYHTSYQIFDEPIFQSGDDRVRILDFGRRMEEGLIVKADTLDALARQIELPAETLRDTVARYNRFVDEGHDPEFGRETLVHRQGELRRIETGPFYAYPSTAAVFGTYCGLRIDAQMKVIDVFGEPIAGLHAAGEVVGGFHGGAYMTGSALGKAVVFGRLAARSAMHAEGAAALAH
ncbi:MAG: flavocytochrome c [Gammaproteobacteria bacterium]|nr:flavocytochrome c [Gammaproteobacteria bacterium]MBU1440214.1 flavocytochrome c [Gammaproteobacteria bacterium]